MNAEAFEKQGGGLSLSLSHSVSSFHALLVLIGRAESPQLTA